MEKMGSQVVILVFSTIGCESMLLDAMRLELHN
jgi:hypothetical protein